MRLLVTLILPTLCAISLSAQRLTNEQVLNQLDDAIASEARWVFTAKEFTVDGAGIISEKTRASVAYKRLLAEKSTKAFELLAQSEVATASVYGLHGLAKLGAATSKRLLQMLSACEIWVGDVLAIDGCFGFEESPTGIYFGLLADCKLEDTSAIEESWQRCLQKMISDGSYSDLAGSYSKVLGRLPEGDTVNRQQAREFALLSLIEDEEERCNKILNLAKTDTKPVLRRLCLAVLTPETKGLIEGIWSRELSDDDIFNLKILAAKVDRIRKQVLNGSYNELFYYGDPYTKLHQLTEKDWQWLEAHGNQDVSGAGKILHQNIITGWQIDSTPSDKVDIQLWLQLCMRHAQDEDSSLRERAILTIRRELKKNIHVFPTSSYEDYVFVEDLGEAIGESALIELGAKAIMSNDSADNWVGLQLILDGGKHDTVLSHFKSAKELSIHIVRIWQNATPEWALKTKISILTNQDIYIEDYFFNKMKNEVEKWFTYLIDKLVTAPRWLPCCSIESCYDITNTFTDFVEPEDPETPSKRYILLSSILDAYETALCTVEEEAKEDFNLSAAEFYKRQKTLLANLKD